MMLWHMRKPSHKNNGPQRPVYAACRDVGGLAKAAGTWPASPDQSQVSNEPLLRLKSTLQFTANTRNCK